MNQGIYESYDDFDKKPIFYSDEYSFRVTFPSKMYDQKKVSPLNGEVNGEANGPVSGPVKVL